MRRLTLRSQRQSSRFWEQREDRCASGRRDRARTGDPPRFRSACPAASFDTVPREAATVAIYPPEPTSLVLNHTPRKGRHLRLPGPASRLGVSIYAPARGRDVPPGRSLPRIRFRSTPARVASDRVEVTDCLGDVSIHAPARAATGDHSAHVAVGSSFNPRLREGATAGRRQLLTRRRRFYPRPCERGDASF